MKNWTKLAGQRPAVICWLLHARYCAERGGQEHRRAVIQQAISARAADPRRYEGGVKTLDTALFLVRNGRQVEVNGSRIEIVDPGLLRAAIRRTVA